MSGTVVTPQIDNANEGSFGGAIDEALKRFKFKLENCLPAVVIAYDRINNVASVQPQIQMVKTDGTLAGRAPVASVPVIALGGGGFSISFPLVAGSKGWIHASDRDISLYLQSGAVAHPNTQRAHSFSDGHFVPDVLANYVLNGEDANNMVIQNTSGTVRVALWPDQIKLSVDDSSFVLNSTGVVVTTANGGKMTLGSGGMAVTGTLTATGGVSAGFGTADQVDLQPHSHPANGQPPTPGT